MNLQFTSKEADWGKIVLSPGSKVSLNYTMELDAAVFKAMSREDLIEQCVLMYRRKIAALYDSVKVTKR